MSFSDRAALERELDQNLRHGRAFLSQTSEVPVLSECVLVLVHPDHGQELRLSAQVVMVNPSGPMCGMGFALRSFGPSEILRVQAFARSLEPANDLLPGADPPPSAAHHPASHPAPAVAATPDAGPAEGAPVDDERAASDASSEMPVSQPDLQAAPADRDDEPASLEGAGAESESSDGDEAGSPAVDDEQEAPLDEDELSQCEAAEGELEEQELALDDELGASQRPSEIQVGNKQEKLRNLNAAHQMKLARTGELAERIALERLYGKQVWEPLLRNPRLSLPEVARIARKGTVPKPLLEIVLDNNAWIKAPQVRRALLSNPKLSGDEILKLLRITPKHELKVLEKSTAYGNAVREAARKLLKQ